MHTATNAAPSRRIQRLAFVVGSALVRWADQAELRAEAVQADAAREQLRARRSQQRRAAEVYLGPRGF